MADVIRLNPRTVDRSGLLRAARERAGLSAAQFASLLGRAIGRPELSPGTLRGWEDGRASPPSEVVEAAQRLAQENLPRLPAPGASSPITPSSNLMVAGSPGPIGTGAGVEAVMQSFRAADRQVGGGYIYGAVIRYLEHDIAPRLFKGSADAFAAAAALTEMAGWMAHDAGADSFAEQHFAQALRFASMTDDIELTAHIHASLSHLAQQLDRPRDGLRLAQAGRRILQRQDHHPALAARLYAMEARALASLRRRADCARALSNAERALDNAGPASPPSPWVSPFDHGSLAAEACQSMQQLGQLAPARLHAEQIIRLRNSNHARSRAFGQLRLAGILVAQGEVEHAAALTQDALAGSGSVSSIRVVQLLRSLQHALTPHASQERIEPVVHQLAATLAQRTHLPLLIDTNHEHAP